MDTIWLFRIVLIAVSVSILVHRVSVYRRKPEPSNDHERKVLAAERLHLGGFILLMACAGFFMLDPIGIMESWLRYVLYAGVAGAGVVTAVGSYRRKDLEMRGGP